MSYQCKECKKRGIKTIGSKAEIRRHGREAHHLKGIAHYRKILAYPGRKQALRITGENGKLDPQKSEITENCVRL
jgi:hypothetical protein